MTFSNTRGRVMAVILWELFYLLALYEELGDKSFELLI
jgi:hypothetical protein